VTTPPVATFVVLSIPPPDLLHPPTLSPRPSHPLVPLTLLLVLLLLMFLPSYGDQNRLIVTFQWIMPTTSMTVSSFSPDTARQSATHRHHSSMLVRTFIFETATATFPNSRKTSLSPRMSTQPSVLELSQSLKVIGTASTQQASVIQSSISSLQLTPAGRPQSAVKSHITGPMSPRS
jgi:hypothetical protein